MNGFLKLGLLTGIVAFLGLGTSRAQDMEMAPATNRTLLLVVGSGKAPADPSITARPFAETDATNLHKLLTDGAHAKIAPGDSKLLVGAEATLATARDHVVRQGLVVVVGLYGGTIPFGFGAVPHEARFMTSVWGSLAQMHEMVALAQRNPLHSPIEVIGLDRIPAAHERLHHGDVSGRFVVVPGGSR